MTTIDEILQAPEDVWVDSLERDQRDTINKLLQSGQTPDQVALLWLSATGNKDVSPFGGAPPNNALCQNFVNELHKFICGDPKYDTERKKILGEFKGHHAFFVGSVSVCIAPFVGAAAPVLAPSIALTLLVVGKLGINAWCSTNFDADQSTNSDGEKKEGSGASTQKV